MKNKSLENILRKAVPYVLAAGSLVLALSLGPCSYSRSETREVGGVEEKVKREPRWEWEEIKEVPEGVEFGSKDTASYGDNIYKIWQDRRDGNFEIYFKYSKDKGKTWSDDIRLTNDPNYSWHPLLAVNKDGVHIVWEDCRDDKDDDGSDEREIYYMKLDHEGKVLIPDKRLTYIINRRFRPNGDMARNPAIAADDNAVHVVWETYLVNPWAIGHHGAGGSDVRYLRSIDGGKTWEGKKNFGEGGCPNITLDREGNIYVIGPDIEIVKGTWRQGYRKAMIKK